MTETPRESDATRQRVRERYSSLARGSRQDEEACCTEAGDTCKDSPGTDARELGYSDEELSAVAAGATLSLGCGNPNALSQMERGETVLDLGSGAGFDCFLAAREVGESGQIIGVDMTPEMISTAREHALTNGVTNVDFRLGEIEHLPVADESVDVVISNCVVNLSPEKPQVFAEAYRALNPGGRLAISDIVSTAPLPADIEADPDSLAACVSGAASVDSIEGMLADAGFAAIAVEPVDESATFIREWDDERDLSEFIVSATIEARKPDGDVGS